MDATSSSQIPVRSAEYVVVARRYRPQSFSDLIGQEQVALALSKAIESQRVGHAYLFTGARGVGKTSAARIFARALNCENGPTPQPCNTCDICQSITSGEDVDVLEIDGASSRGIDEVRQLRSNVNVRPSRARFKIYIIDEVHMFTKEAFNALLKTLEEPPEHVKFIFCTTDPEKIPITVLSRCQRFDFPPVQTTSIAQRLGTICQAEGVQAEPEALQLLARRAAGSMRDSQSLLEQLLSFGEGRITVDDVHRMLGTARSGSLVQLVGELAEHRADGALRVLESAIREGVDLGQFAEQLLGYFRDLLAATVGCSPDLLLQTLPDDYPQLQQMGRRIGLETLLAMIQVLDQSITRMRQSPHVRTLLEVALVRIANLQRLDDIARLVAELHGPAATGPVAGATSPAKAAPEAHGAEKKTTDPEPVVEPVVADPPPVASAVAPRGLGGLTDDNALSAWRTILDRLAASEDILADMAAKFSAVRAVGPGRLAIEFQAEYNKGYCERPERLARLQQVAAEVVGRPVQFEFSLSAKAASVDAAPVVSRRQRMREVENHPLVAQAKQMFDAEVVDVQWPRGADRSASAPES